MNGQETIEEMFAFVVVDDDGTEGIIGQRNADGGWMPLVGADMARVESLIPYAQTCADAIGKPVQVLRFSIRDELQIIEPK